MKRKTISSKRLHTYIRAIIQLMFFIFFPSAFTTAFSGIKYIFTQIGAGQPIVWTSFITVLLALCAYTIIFGRFFCGYACAFGSLGDAIHAAYIFICKKLKKKPIQIKKNWRKALSLVKYGVLFIIVLLCFTGVYSKITGWNPWDVFSMLRAGNFKLGGYILGCIILFFILIGMALCERFFCRFLCPMGAIFSILPVFPLFSVRRKKENCVKGCSACEHCCPSDLIIPEEGEWTVNGDCFQCQKCIDICPKKNTHSGRLFFKGNEIWFTMIRTVILLVILILAGI